MSCASRNVAAVLMVLACAGAASAQSERPAAVRFSKNTVPASSDRSAASARGVPAGVPFFSGGTRAADAARSATAATRAPSWTGESGRGESRAGAWRGESRGGHDRDDRRGHDRGDWRGHDRDDKGRDSGVSWRVSIGTSWSDCDDGWPRYSAARWRWSDPCPPRPKYVYVPPCPPPVVVAPCPPPVVYAAPCEPPAVVVNVPAPVVIAPPPQPPPRLFPADIALPSDRLGLGPLAAPGAGDPNLSGGWALLAAGDADRALRLFADEAESLPGAALSQVGYALAAAAVNQTARAEWAMKRALAIDPYALARVPASPALTDVIVRIEARYLATGRLRPDAPDAQFLFSAMRWLAGDAAAAQSAAFLAGDAARDAAVANLRAAVAQPRDPAAFIRPAG